MTTRRRRRFTADFKKRVALQALRGDRMVQEIAARHEVHPNQVSTWKRQAIDGLDEILGGGTIKGDRHLVYASGTTPMTNLQFTMLQKLGVPVDRFGDSTGTLKELSELA